MAEILLGVTGSIAAYKAAELANVLVKSGHNVNVIMTKAATKFIAPLTFATLTHNRVYTDMFDDVYCDDPRDVRHISLAKRAAVAVIAPASANIIGKLAGGIADDMLSTVIMATTASVLICPAMNTAMYENAVVQRNIATLTEYGQKLPPRYVFVEPREARLACGDLGRGAMAEVDVIAGAVAGVLRGL